MLNNDEVIVKDRDADADVITETYHINWNVNGLKILTFCYDCS